MKYLVGIDGGGTKSRLLACSVTGEVLGRCVGKSTNIESNSCVVVRKHLEELIEGFLRNTGLCMTDCLALCIGTAGVDSENSLQAVKDILASMQLPCPAYVMNDAEIALAAQTMGEPGVLLISGTGSIGFAVNAKGERWRVGGYGYLVGDEGSAYWIGRKAISAVLRAHDGTGPQTLLTELLKANLRMGHIDELMDFVYQSNKADIAKLAPQVVAAFENGDEVATYIMKDAVKHLSRMALTLGERLGMQKEKCPLVFAGGFFLNTPWMIETVAERVISEYPHWNPMILSTEAESGAIYLAAKKQGLQLEMIDPDVNVKDRVLITAYL